VETAAGYPWGGTRLRRAGHPSKLLDTLSSHTLRKRPFRKFGKHIKMDYLILVINHVPDAAAMNKDTGSFRLRLVTDCEGPGLVVIGSIYAESSASLFP
jgi:hypothetical protein